MNGSRIDWQWSAVVAYSVSFMTLGALSYAKIVHPEVLLSMLTWLAPSPWLPRPNPPLPSGSRFDA